MKKWNPNLIKGVYKIPIRLKWLELIMGLGHLI